MNYKKMTKAELIKKLENGPINPNIVTDCIFNGVVCHEQIEPLKMPKGQNTPIPCILRPNKVY